MIHDGGTVPFGRTTDIEDGVADEQASFEMFFRAEHARLYRALCMVVGSRDEAEEIAQDAFLRLWERWDRVSSMEAPTAYLFQVAMSPSQRIASVRRSS
jgi:DNA-directed RNA polymerase specialized sigma24 family protein